jgi:NAD(P)-dependent dehydrogenase (short-subunit alcohol dehydrogenase family)
MPLLEAASAASVVLTSSGVGRQGKAYWGAYAVSKFATEGYMQVLADELSATSSVRVNSLNPGAVNTSMRRAAYPGEPPDTNPVPAALTDRWLYLLSDASRNLHGQAFNGSQAVKRLGTDPAAEFTRHVGFDVPQPAGLFWQTADDAPDPFWTMMPLLWWAVRPSDRSRPHRAAAIPATAPF